LRYELNFFFEFNQSTRRICVHYRNETKAIFSLSTSDVVLKTGLGLKTIFWGLGLGLGQKRSWS